MRRLPAFLVATLALLAAGRAAEPAAPALTAAPLAAPATAGKVTGPALARGPDGALWLSWLETADAVTALRVASLDPATRTWRAPVTVARGRDLFVNTADVPALTVGPAGRLAAVWSVNNPAPANAPAAPAAGHDHHGPGYHAVVSHSTDAGQTWSAPVPLTRESTSVEFAAVTFLADGRLLAAWLDGRAKAAGGKSQQLYARILSAPTPAAATLAPASAPASAPAAAAPDTLVDASVCDCCPVALTAFPDGTALLAYRGRTADEVRDIRVTRFRRTTWDDPRPAAGDDWRIAACPVNGPALISDGGRVGAAWFTAADNDPRLLVTFSPDAGARFLMPLRLSETKPAGRPALALLRDSALLTAWVDATGALLLRRVSPEFSPSAAVVPLAAPAAGLVRGRPALAVLRDYAGGKEPAVLVAAYTSDAATDSLRTLLVSVPEGDLLESEKSCDCAPTAEQLQGFSIRGTVEALDAAAGTARIRHFEVPGIFDAGTRELRAAPALVENHAAVGRQFLGKIEQRAGAWWLFDVRFIAGPPR